jgi:sigma-B regulation protein RsbU (phosphoserine phosphatase)
LVAVAGLTWFAVSGSPYGILRINTLLAILSMVLLGVTVVFPRMAKKYLPIRSTAVRIAMPLIALVTVYVNVLWFFGTPPAPYVEPITFAIFASAIGFEAASHTFENERRLLSLENELETARQIQSSLLPDCTPVIDGLRISAEYQPMSAVAGDFYQFVSAGDCGVGLIVADVTGHGVPAALIASMIKVAMQSAVPFASEPAKVLSLLNRILTPELHGHLTSAEYIWVDPEYGTVRYSGAGHPPILHWKHSEGELVGVECNGILFGVAGNAEYPEYLLKIGSGDRLLVYTDGLVEAENGLGEAFGDRQMKDLVRDYAAASGSNLIQVLLKALKTWPPPGQSQQDDITLVVVDLL